MKIAKYVDINIKNICPIYSVMGMKQNIYITSVINIIIHILRRDLFCVRL